MSLESRRNNLGTYYREMENHRFNDTAHILMEVSNGKEAILSFVKNLFGHYAMMNMKPFNEQFYKWFECNLEYEQNYTVIHPHVWALFDILINRIVSLQLLYIQFMNEVRKEEETKLFLLVCNYCLSTSQLPKSRLLDIMHVYDVALQFYNTGIVNQQNEELKKTKIEEYVKFNDDYKYYF